MANAYPNWSLTEIKNLTHREREFWLEMAVWTNTPKQPPTRRG